MSVRYPPTVGGLSHPLGGLPPQPAYLNCLTGCEAVSTFDVGVGKMALSHLESKVSPKKTTRTVLVVDPSRIVREWIVARLPDDRFHVLQAGNGQRGIRLVTEQQPDVALVDIDVPDMTGTDLCERLIALNSKLTIVVLTHATDNASVMGAFTVGVRSYLLKDSDDLDIERAIDRSLEREAVIDPRVAPILTASVVNNRRSTTLSAQELRIVQLVAFGHSNREIGQRVRLSPHTVKEHLANAMRKLGVASRVEAALVARRRGLIR
jgi:DNA-binding NarL/FixJ family response regulator